MSKRPSRPWEVNDSDHRQMPVDPVPSILVDGVEYFSDAFYLNRGVDDPPVASTTNDCTCGARAPPPLLDRGRLVASLNLKAAIVASYTVEPSHIIKEYPSLFGPDSNVPTLILHGHKGMSERMKRKKKTTPMSSKENSQSSNNSRIDTKAEEYDESGAICIGDESDQDEHIARIKTEFNESEQIAIKEEEEPPEDAWLRKLNESLVPEKARLGKLVHMTEVLSTWVPESAKREIESMRRQQNEKAKDDNDVIVLDSEDEETPVDTRYGVEQFVVERRHAKRGVHHPKYMILFETSGSVVVLVTSANLTPQHAVDASWVQRFEASETKDMDFVTDATRCDGSDFGYVLANYLECQSLAARGGEMIPEVFLLRYLGYATLQDFRRAYRWNSQVHLIATVPGEHKGAQTLTHLGESGTRMTFLYGSQRVSDILCRLSESSASESESSQTFSPWLPQALLSNDDRLIIQPTSFGGLWKQESLRDVVRLYYDPGSSNKSTNPTSSDHSKDILNQADILWPTRDYMAEIHGKWKSNRVPSPDSVTSIKTDSSSAASSNVATDGSFCFLSSVSFNTIDFPCIARMSTFEPSYPMQNPSNRSPHIKSIARLFEGDDYRLRQCYNAEKAQEYLSWYMLTSACLSRGAQGEATPHRAFDSDEMSFSNFELGVLFVSRLTADSRSDRLYCWMPSKCHCGQSCRSKKRNVQMIHLPLPYRLRPRAYLEDKDETDLCTTPYFHEIPKGTGFEGHMARTPLGASLAAAQL